jgi:hypothetical protein
MPSNRNRNIRNTNKLKKEAPSNKWGVTVAKRVTGAVVQGPANVIGSFLPKLKGVTK